MKLGENEGANFYWFPFSKSLLISELRLLLLDLYLGRGFSASLMLFSEKTIKVRPDNP
jgi:hypothetical protein